MACGFSQQGKLLNLNWDDGRRKLRPFYYTVNIVIRRSLQLAASYFVNKCPTEAAARLSREVQVVSRAAVTRVTVLFAHIMPLRKRIIYYDRAMCYCDE